MIGVHLTHKLKESTMKKATYAGAGMPLDQEHVPIAVICEPPTDALSRLFGQYEVPPGLLAKLRLLEGLELCFILDDSSSMFTATKVDAYESAYMRLTRPNPRDPGTMTSRWDELFDRVHLMIDFVANIDIGSVKIMFMNRQRTYTFYRREYVTAEEFASICHARLAEEHASRPSGSTPTMGTLRRALSADPQAIYLFTDGEPRDASPEEIARYVIQRKSPESHPITLLPCTDDDSEVAWLKELDEDAKYVAEVDDYVTERGEVVRAQGTVFPYTKGVWILCMLVAAMDPECLDRLDERVPLSRDAMEKMLGRPLEESEYARYIRNHPKNRPASPQFPPFCTVS